MSTASQDVISQNLTDLTYPTVEICKREKAEVCLKEK